VRAKLAHAHSKSSNLDEAETEYERVLNVTRYHIDSLIGLGQVYVEMGDRLTDQLGAAKREYFYARAIERFSEAIQVASSKNRPSSFSGSLSSVYYLSGYTKIKLQESSRLARDSSLVRGALRDFAKCEPLDPDYHKARRAIARIRDEALRSSPRSLIERGAPSLISLLAILMFALAQFGFFYGLPVRSERVQLTDQSFGAFTAAGVGTDVIDQLKQMEGIPFRTREELLARAKEVLGDDGLAKAKNAILRHAARLEASLEFERIEVSYYALIAFGALLFMIAGAYLPQLTRLKFAGLQLDKSTAERVETVRSIGIDK
jgi:hypothetical protein